MTDASHAMPALLERMRRLPARPPRAAPRAGLEALKALNHSLHSPAAGLAGAKQVSGAPRPVEMKSVQQFRQSWQRMQVQDQVERALQQGPVNAGPLNSHRLVLQTLGLMQDLSPAYQHHFMSHLDTMLQLDTLTLPQAGKPAKAGKSAKPATRKAAAKK